MVRKYSREFKLSAVKLVKEQGYTIPQVAKSLGIDARNVRYWVEVLGSEAGSPASGEAALRTEVQRLRKENARLLLEREILKKAAGTGFASSVRSLPRSSREVRLHCRSAPTIPD